MTARSESQPTAPKPRTTLDRKSDRELVVTRTINGPARLVFEAWSKPEIFLQWWLPQSIGISVVSSEADVRTGGRYRYVFRQGTSEPMAFFGRYLESDPHPRSSSGPTRRPRPAPSPPSRWKTEETPRCW